MQQYNSVFAGSYNRECSNQPTSNVKPIKIIEGEDMNFFSFLNEAKSDSWQVITAKLNRCRVQVSDTYELPPVALSVNMNGETYPFGTLGNFSLIIGKAKSKKTFTISMILAACGSGSQFDGVILPELPSNQQRVILFDTEQSKYHVWKVLQRTARLAGVQDLSNIEVYSLRECSPTERIMLIEHVLVHANTDNTIGLAVIDGIRDLVHDINDPKEGTSMSTNLLQWTTKSNAHIITVLHENKNDKNPRGHLGTELLNKAETVISVTVAKDNKSISIIEAESTRDKDFPGFAFQIDEQGLPVILPEYLVEEKAVKRKAFNPYDIDPSVHKKILAGIFSKTPSLSRPDLIAELKIAWGASDQCLGDNKTKELIIYYTTMNWLCNKASAGKLAQYVFTPEG